jgi:hypothetical protein
MEAIMETPEPGAVEPVVEPTMAQVAAGEPATPPEPTPEPIAVEPTKGDPPTPVDPPSDPAQDAVQKRINKITADKYAEKRRADDLQAKLDAQVSKPALPADAPQLEDFDYDDGKHQAAVIQYEVRKALESAQQVTNQQHAQQARQKVANDFSTKEAEYLVKHPEYTEEVATLPKFPQDTLNAIFELGPQVSHYLAKHLDVAAEVASASPTMAAVKLGQISMGLTADTKIVKPSSAPDPVKTLNGAAGVVTKSQEDMSMKEIMDLPN